MGWAARLLDLVVLRVVLTGDGIEADVERLDALFAHVEDQRFGLLHAIAF